MAWKGKLGKRKKRKSNIGKKDTCQKKQKLFPFWTYGSVIEVRCIRVESLTSNLPTTRRGGGGGTASLKVGPGCVCWGSENVPILKDASGRKNIPILKGSPAYFIPIL